MPLEMTRKLFRMRLDVLQHHITQYKSYLTVHVYVLSCRTSSGGYPQCMSIGIGMTLGLLTVAAIPLQYVHDRYSSRLAVVSRGVALLFHKI